MSRHFHIVVSDFQVEGDDFSAGALCAEKVYALQAIKFPTWYAAAVEALPMLLKKCTPFNDAQVWKTEDNPEGAALLDLLDFSSHYLVELYVVEDVDDGACNICAQMADFAFQPMTLEELCASGMWSDTEREQDNAQV